MTHDVRLATLADLDPLVALMDEFYRESHFELDRVHARSAFAALLSDPALGRIWLIDDDTEPVGYAVLTLGYSMEYGGRDGFVDDLFIRHSYRGRGLGRLVFESIRATAESLGVRALHLEVGRDNQPAQRLYRGSGFADTDRQLLTLRLADPTHRTPVPADRNVPW